MTTTITALQINKYGSSEEVFSTTIPKPQIKKDTEILVKVKVAAVNPADLLFIAGNYNQKAESFPSRVGFEGSGIVEEAGKEVKEYKEGQRIHFISLGAWAEYIIIDTAVAKIVPIPDSLSFEDAAQLTINPLTAIGMLDVLNPKEGEFLVQNAASSALARIVIQLAKAKGVKTINVVRREEHREPLKAIGADYVINQQTQDITTEINKISPGGVKYALDAVAGKGGEELVKILAEEGTLLIYGVLGGFNINVDSLSVKGFYLYKWASNRGVEKIKADYEFLINSILSKKLSLPSQPFETKTQFAQALKHAQTPGKSEKTVLLF